ADGSDASGDGAGDSDGSELPLVIQRAMRPSTAIAVVPHDLAVSVDPIGSGVEGAGDVDGSEHPLVIQKAMWPTAIEVVPHDLAVSVDPIDSGVEGAGEGNIDRGEVIRGGLGDR